MPEAIAWFEETWREWAAAAIECSQRNKSSRDNIHRSNRSLAACPVRPVCNGVGRTKKGQHVDVTDPSDTTVANRR